MSEEFEIIEKPKYDCDYNHNEDLIRRNRLIILFISAKYLFKLKYPHLYSIYIFYQYTNQSKE